jgi:hypothetical protein
MAGTILSAMASAAGRFPLPRLNCTNLMYMSYLHSTTRHFSPIDPRINGASTTERRLGRKPRSAAHRVHFELRKICTLVKEAALVGISDHAAQPSQYVKS